MQLRVRLAFLFGSVVIFCAIYYFWQSTNYKMRTHTGTAAVTAAAAASPVNNQNADVKFPIPEVSETPSQVGSRTAAPTTFADELFALMGQEMFSELMNSTDLIHRIVITVENLTSPSQPSQAVSPLKPLAGEFAVVTKDGKTVIDIAGNLSRYSPYLRLIRISPVKLASLYIKYYPQFQAEYQVISGGKYFNDQVVNLIDSLLKTPEIETSLSVAKVQNHYKFIDDRFEDLSSGQKILIRFGSDGEKLAKKQLRTFRALLVNGKKLAFHRRAANG